MADNKNQHFVPKCHLKPFSSNEEGSAIHLFNLKSQRCIYDAPTRGQCSRSYFYGKDLGLERKLGKVEGAYGAAIRELEGDILTLPDTANFLRDFSYLQFSRTEAFVRARDRYLMALDDAIYEGREDDRPEFRQESWETAKAAIDMFAETLPEVADLKPVILFNRTATPFITSDNPAVYTNRLHLQKLNDRSFGLAHAGGMFILPLTPKYAVLSFDPAVYTVGLRRSGFVEIGRDADVDAINQLQILNCSENVYFGDRAHCGYALKLHGVYADLRVSDRPRFDVLVPDGKTAEGERFRTATLDERRTAKRKFIVSSAQHVKPRHWPSFLAYRSGAHGYTDGSAAGVIRHASIASRGRAGRRYRKRVF